MINASQKFNHYFVAVPPTDEVKHLSVRFGFSITWLLLEQYLGSYLDSFGICMMQFPK